MFRAGTIVVGVIGLGLSAIPVTAQKQCGGETGGQVASCQSSECYGYYQSYPPAGSVYWWVAIYLPCCGQQVKVWTTEYSGCGSKSELPQETKTTLALLSEHGIDVMIQDCEGHFHRYIASGALPFAG